MDDVSVLVANALMSSHLDYYNSLPRSLSSFNMRKLQCSQNTLGMIVTNCNRYSGATPILKKQSNFGVFSKLPLWFISFFTMFTQVISALFCLFVVEGMAQDTTAQIKASWRFPSVHISTQIQKTLWSQFCF